MASTSNNFCLLDAAPVSGDAAHKKKNRKAKKKANKLPDESGSEDTSVTPSGKAFVAPRATPTQPAQPVVQPVKTAPAPVVLDRNMSLDDACHQLLRVATKDKRVSVWEDWIFQVKAGDSSVKYSTPSGLVNFHKALLYSGAFETTVAHCMCAALKGKEQALLAQLLSCCLPSLDSRLVTDLAASLTAMSSALEHASRDLQQYAASAVRSVFAVLKAPAAQGGPAAGGANLETLDAELRAKQAAVQKCLEHTHDMTKDHVATATHAVTLSTQKFDLLSRPGNTQALAQATQALGSLTQTIESYLSPLMQAGGQRGNHNNGGAQSHGSTQQDIAALDGMLANLYNRFRDLESQLESCQAEIEASKMRRSQLVHLAGQQVQGNSAPAGGQVTAAAYQRQLAGVHALRAALERAAPQHHTGATPDQALFDLLRSCIQAAQVQDKYMEALMSQVTFARGRAANAQRMAQLNRATEETKGEAMARKLFSDIRDQSNATRVAASRLQALVLAQEGAINASANYSTLRNQAMQVSQIVNQVLSRHEAVLSAASTTPPVATAAAPTMSMTLDSILSMDVNGAGSKHSAHAATPSAGQGSTLPPLAASAPSVGSANSVPAANGPAAVHNAVHNAVHSATPAPFTASPRHAQQAQQQMHVRQVQQQVPYSNGVMPAPRPGSESTVAPVGRAAPAPHSLAASQQQQHAQQQMSAPMQQQQQMPMQQQMSAPMQQQSLAAPQQQQHHAQQQMSAPMQQQQQQQMSAPMQQQEMPAPMQQQQQQQQAAPNEPDQLVSRAALALAQLQATLGIPATEIAAPTQRVPNVGGRGGRGTSARGTNGRGRGRAPRS